LPQQLALDAAFAGAVFGLAVLATRFSARASVLCLGFAVLPVAGLAALSLTVAQVWVPRYALFTLCGWLLLAGAALARFSGGRLHAVAVVAALLLVSTPRQVALRSAAGHSDADHRAIAGIVGREARPGDAILFPYRGRFREGLWHYLAQDKRPRDVMAAGSASGAGRLEVPECERPERCLGTPTRVWVLCDRDCGDATEGLREPVRKALNDAGYREAQRWHVHRGTVAVFQR
jgi:mannosyltransferase